MIRRDAGDEWWLIRQTDHALLSGRLAESWGNDTWAEPTRGGESVEGITLHDAGWPSHDDAPTLNPAGEPLHVFETPMAIGLPVWAESTRRATSAGAWAGLLVSLHGMHLCALAVGRKHFDLTSNRARFAVTKFQNEQAQAQMRLRQQVGLQIDQPTTLGLRPESNIRDELSLIYDFRLLQACDALSLNVCCTTLLVDQIGPLPTRPGAPSRRLICRRNERADAVDLFLDPWPMKQSHVKVDLPYRALPRRTFDTVEAFHDALATAEERTLCVSVRPG